jgi:cytochrome c oxidase subunit I+III
VNEAARQDAPPLPDSDEELRRQLEESWRDPRGFLGWFTNVSHRTIGARYIVTAFAFLILGGLEAAVMRLQLARPSAQVISQDLYNQLFTMHGSTMMFLFAVPVMLGAGVILVPTMVGTREVSFPRLNAFSYYMFLFGGLLLYAGFFTGTGPDVGWFAYTPLSGPQFGAGKRVDFWAQMITFTEMSALGVAVNLIVTILKQRAPGMSLARMPLFVWAMLVTSFMVVFAMPSVMLGSGALLLDRLIGTHIFNHAEGGDQLLWQHLFWFFGHPEVYIIFLPAVGMMSHLISNFARRKPFGYHALVLATASTAFVAFGVWVHHMFATGLPQLGQSYFTASSMIITIPTGVQVFCWLATLWGARPRFHTPLLFAMGFFTVFVIGGLTGVMLASVPLDLQVHDTFFVVAHLHYVLIGGGVFPLLGGLYFWWPKFTGRLLDERLGKVSFWLLFAGFNLTFFPMHVLGLHGMPRRIYTYAPESGWGTLNLLASIGAGLIAVALLLTLINCLRSFRRGAPAGDNPWKASGLEWWTTSPPAPYTFLYLPVVEGRDPLWEREAPELPVVTGIHGTRREVLVTTLLEARPDHRKQEPSSSPAPLLMALGVGVGFVVSIFSPWGGVISAVAGVAVGVPWFWPQWRTVHGHEKASQ